MEHERSLVIASASCFLAFAILGRLVAPLPPTRIDVETTSWRGHLTALAVLFTRLGRWYSVVALTLIAFAAVAAVRGDALVVVELFVVQVLGQGVVNALKLAFRRPRPDRWLHRFEVGFSYPSGHAATAVVLFAGLLVLALRSSSVPHAVLPLLALLLGACIVGVPWSRIALGAHYATDVLGGLLFGAGWLLAFAALALRAGAQTAA